MKLDDLLHFFQLQKHCVIDYVDPYLLSYLAQQKIFVCHLLKLHPRHLSIVFSLIPSLLLLSSLMSSLSPLCLLRKNPVPSSAAAQCCFILADNYL